MVDYVVKKHVQITSGDLAPTLIPRDLVRYYLAVHIFGGYCSDMANSCATASTSAVESLRFAQSGQTYSLFTQLFEILFGANAEAFMILDDSGPDGDYSVRICHAILHTAVLELC